MSTGLRLMSYLVKKFSGLVVVALLVMLTAFIAYDLANIYMVISDGMTQRTTTVLNRRDPADLNRFFTLKFLNSDPLFHSDQYRDYLIQDYDYQLRIKRMWVWPWQAQTKVIVEEFIPGGSWRYSATEDFKARLQAAMTPNEDGTNKELVIPPPQWQNGEKLIEFRKVDRKWKIDRIVFVRPLEDKKD